MKLYILGNCANLTNTYRTTSACLEFEGFRILLEAGPAVVPALQDLGIPASSLNAMIISHSHGDHTLGFPYVLFSKFAEGIQGMQNVSPVSIYGLPYVLEGLKAMFSFCYPPGKYDSYEIDFKEIDGNASSIVRLNENILLRTLSTKHSVSSVAYRFEVNNHAFVFTNDTILSDNLVEFCAGATSLFAEAFGPADISDMAHKLGHATAFDAGQLAEKSRVQSLYLTHILPPFMEKGDLLTDSASQHFTGKIVIPKQGDIIQLS